MPVKKSWPAQKRMAAQLLGCGLSRVRMASTKEVAEALTREDVRQLIKKGLIWAAQPKGTSRGAARHRLVQKKRGRRAGIGSRKGKMGARVNRKAMWIARVRALRALASQFKRESKITPQDYRRVYVMIKGGAFRSKKHMIAWLRENEMIREAAWEK